MLPKKSTRIRREEIIRASLQVLSDRGAGGLTIAAIAERAGMSEANIYRHFAGKGEILHALTEFIGATLMGKAAATAAGSGGPKEKLRTVFFNHFATIAEHPGIPRLVFSEEVHLGERQVAEALSGRIASYVETLAGIIAAGVAEGELRKDLAPRETALTLLGMISFAALRWSLSRYSFDIREEAGRLWENFERLLL